jgi:hypothetical protein
MIILGFWFIAAWDIRYTYFSAFCIHVAIPISIAKVIPLLSLVDLHDLIIHIFA